MAANQLLVERHGKPVRSHQRKVVALKSDLRWCSDSLEVRCWNWEKVHRTFVLDCCDEDRVAHSRESPQCRRRLRAAP